MAPRRREFEGVEHTDVVRLATRRERHKTLFERIRDAHNDPEEALKPYLVLGLLALIFMWAPFVPEIILFLTVMIALSNSRFKNRLWDAPYRVPRALGFNAPGAFLDKSTNAPGDGMIYHGVGRGAFAGQEVWSTPRDLQTHRLVIGGTGSGKTEEILGLVFNALSLNSGAILVDGKASADTLNSLRKIARLFGREEDLLVLCFMMGAKDFYGQSDVKLTNTFNPFSMGSSDQKSTLMETFIPRAEGSNSVFAQRAMQLNKALPRPLTLLQEMGYVEYNPRLLTEFFQLNNVENLVWFGRFRDKHGKEVNLQKEGKHREFLLLKQACASLEQVLTDLPGYTQVMPKEPPPMIDANDTKIAAALMEGESSVEALSKDMMTAYRKLAEGGFGSGGDQQQGNQSADATRSEIYRQWGYMTMSLSEPAAMLTYTFGHVFNAEVGEINMSDVFLNRRLVFVMIPSLEKAPESTRSLGKVTVAAVKQVLGNLLYKPLEGDRRQIVDASPSKSQMPYPMIFDEYGYYVVDGFSVAAAQARSFGVSCTFGMQTTDSLKKASEAEASETIQNTTLRHIGRFVGGEDSDTYRTIRGWAGKQLTSGVKSMKVAAKAAFKSTTLSDEIVYEEEDVVRYPDLAGQENGQFHLIVGTQRHDGGQRLGETRTIRYMAFYTGDVPEVTEWRINHFVPVKPRDGASIEAIRRRERQENLMTESTAATVREWSLTQADAESQYNDHLGDDALAYVIAEVAMMLGAIAPNTSVFGKNGPPNKSWSIDQLADSLEKMLASGAFQKGEVDLALRLALEALEERSTDAMINRNMNNLQSSLIEGYATSMGAWGLSDAEQKLAQKAFGMLIDAPLRQSRSFDLRTSAIASSTKAAADAAKSRRLAAE